MTRLYALMGVALLVVLAGGMVSHGAVTGTSTIVRTTTVGVGPGNIQVDEQSGRAFVINMDSNTVSVLDTRTGALVHTVDMGRATVPTHRPAPRGPFALTIDARAGRVVVADISGGVSTLDARSGRLLRTVPVGWDPTHVVVDEQAGRALVLNAGGSSAPNAFGWVPSWVPGIQHPARPCNNAPQPGTGVAPTCRLVPGSVTVLDATR